MKTALVLGLLLPPVSHANPIEAPTVDSSVKTYSGRAYADYNYAYETARLMHAAIARFVASPSEQNLEAAKEAWDFARSAYSPTEVYRFFESPIDDADGPEGLINAWPLDEAYIDYVVGNKNAGIINDLAAYPEITKELLVSLNEKDGEKNVSTGFHAIEFLLWGQDFNPSGPGNRPVKDFIVGEGKNAGRRAQYLLAAAELLVEHLESVRKDWEPGGAYATEFSAGGIESLKKMLLGAFRLSGDELAHERMFVAYDTQQQEDEHSCFSDTTHLDFRYNFIGLRSVLQSKTGVVEVLRAVDPARAEALAAAEARAGEAVFAILGPFDRAIYSPEGRAAILAAVTALEDLAAEIQAGAKALGIELE